MKNTHDLLVGTLSIGIPSLGNGLICFYVGLGVGRRRFCKRVSLEDTVEL